MARVRKTFVPDLVQEGDGLRTAARTGLFDITLKLAAIGGYNAERNIRDLEGQFIADTDVAVLTAYALHPEKIVRGKREFVELLQAAGVSPDVVLNENLKLMFGAQSRQPPPPPPLQPLPIEDMSVRVVDQSPPPPPPPMLQMQPMLQPQQLMQPQMPPLQGPFAYPQVKRGRGRPRKTDIPLPPMPPLQYMGLPREPSAAHIPLPDESVSPGKRKDASFDLPEPKRKGGVLSDYQAIDDE